MFQISCDSMSSNPGNLFILQVDNMSGVHVKTVQSSWPQFTLGELQSGTTYKVNVRNKSKLINPTFSEVRMHRTSKNEKLVIFCVLIHK